MVRPPPRSSRSRARAKGKPSGRRPGWHAVGVGDLALDTAGRRLGDGRFEATLSRDWEIWGPNGGDVAAVALRAAGAAAGPSRPAAVDHARRERLRPPPVARCRVAPGRRHGAGVDRRAGRLDGPGVVRRDRAPARLGLRPVPRTAACRADGRAATARASAGPAVPAEAASRSGCGRPAWKSVPSVYATGNRPAWKCSCVGDAEEVGGLPLAVQVQRGPGAAEAPTAQRQVQAPHGGQDRAPPARLLERGRRRRSGGRPSAPRAPAPAPCARPGTWTDADIRASLGAVSGGSLRPIPADVVAHPLAVQVGQLATHDRGRRRGPSPSPGRCCRSGPGTPAAGRPPRRRAGTGRSRSRRRRTARVVVSTSSTVSESGVDDRPGTSNTRSPSTGSRGAPTPRRCGRRARSRRPSRTRCRSRSPCW